MEFALRSDMPNYAGGLGVLATDILRSCADLGKSVCAVSLMYHVSDDSKTAFRPDGDFKKRDEIVHIHIEDRNVAVGVWEYKIKGEGGEVPIYFLDTNLPENKRWDRDITKDLYAMDPYTRLCQEGVLGFAGVRMLRALGYKDIQTYHMNEGHAAFLTLELAKEFDFKDEEVKKRCVFTTHTPIAAGHDHFGYKLAESVLGGKLPWHIKNLAGGKDLNMTQLALGMSKSANAVSRNHKEVCQMMFPNFEFDSITNGVHVKSWVSPGMEVLFDEYLGNWKEDPKSFLHAEKIPDEELKKAHLSGKKTLIEYVNSQPEHFPIPHDELESEDKFDEKTLTVTFARRFVPYKRPLLIFHDLEKLRSVAYEKLQLIFAGPYHPDNKFAMETINQLMRIGIALRGQIKVAILPDYNLDIARYLVQGSDVWLNNPEPPMEASGTSGMKAAINGVLNLSILDGWWLEGYEECHKSGWAFGRKSTTKSSLNRDSIDAKDLYVALEDVIENYEHKEDLWLERMKHAISLGATFNTHRCVNEYEEKMWNQ